VVFIGGRWGGRRRGGPFGGGYGGYGPGYGSGPGYGRRYGPGGGGCARDACLLQSGCCLAEGLDGNCLFGLVLALPSLLPALVAGGRGGVPGSGVRARPGARLLLALLRWYQQAVSPRHRACCRFTPTCSHYAVEAVTRHGAWRGGLLTVRRLLRCRPGGARGADPVPPR